MRKFSPVTSGITLCLIAACLICGCTDTGAPADITGTATAATPLTADPIDIENVTVQTASVDDIQIAYKEFGDGPPLVLIMGYAGTMDMWDVRVLQELARHYRVVVFDNRGMGLSTSSEKEYTISLFANDTAAFMEAIGREKAHILGWSMGSDIALALTHEHPERVDKLILYAADPGGDESVPMDPEVEKALLNTSGTPMERGMRLLSLLFPSDWMAQHPSPEEYFPNVTESTPAENIARQGEAMGARKGVSAWLGTVTQPTLLIVGDQDILARPANSFYIGERIPSASVVQIRGGGHGVMYQYPEDFTDIVLTFLELEQW
ncbi:alpha/beta hydrolase [Methanogenium sp. S4BF]|uniref:alpha/beta fold hydrolase n=1 Tax=Methanogenium sp. S4BF TaxID=1789226 RepID=UPI0024171F3C|nr:alpha/beta hydrolase [Methanogenium sp. S4BF]WFN33938.1 alpha/beta hydrolase [Methanogenium sp. S4BF]